MRVAKFKDAYNQGREQARFFLEKIAALYRREEQYRDNNCTSEEFKELRNDSYTEDIVNSIESEM